jgi:hypothetical protein
MKGRRAVLLSGFRQGVFEVVGVFAVGYVDVHFACQARELASA